MAKYIKLSIIQPSVSVLFESDLVPKLINLATMSPTHPHNVFCTGVIEESSITLNQNFSCFYSNELHQLLLLQRKPLVFFYEVIRKFVSSPCHKYVINLEKNKQLLKNKTPLLIAVSLVFVKINVDYFNLPFLKKNCQGIHYHTLLLFAEK